ncbi:MAG: FHA domain-containing protein [Deltaproteobacteria bacterium]|nr:FHA domain-containing protein [Deltaproteobacteria bacterium]
MLRFWLRFQATEHELPVGTFVAGRSGECQLILDDLQVSRRHAQFTVDANRLFVEDLGSRNGVLVNRAKINGPTRLRDGDTVLLGQNEYLVVARADDAPAVAPVSRNTRQKTTLGAEEQPAESAPTQTGPSLLALLIDRAVTLNNPAEAERMLDQLLAMFLTAVARGSELPMVQLESLSRCVARVVATTGRPKPVDVYFGLLAESRKPLSAALVDELQVALQRLRDVPTAGLQRYVDALRAEAPRLGIAERYAVQRLEGLLRALRGG